MLSHWVGELSIFMNSMNWAHCLVHILCHKVICSLEPRMLQTVCITSTCRKYYWHIPTSATPIPTTNMYQMTTLAHNCHDTTQNWTDLFFRSTVNYCLLCLAKSFLLFLIRPTPMLWMPAPATSLIAPVSRTSIMVYHVIINMLSVLHLLD